MESLFGLFKSFSALRTFRQWVQDDGSVWINGVDLWGLSDTTAICPTAALLHLTSREIASATARFMTNGRQSTLIRVRNGRDITLSAPTLLRAPVREQAEYGQSIPQTDPCHQCLILSSSIGSFALGRACANAYFRCESTRGSD